MLKQNVSLKDYSNYAIGGKCDYFLEVFSKEDLIKGISQWNRISSTFPQNKKQIFILGEGTNILFLDEGLDGLVIKISTKGIWKNKNEIEVLGGESIENLLDFCIENSLSGLEWAGGLPGTVGGAIRGNAGAFGGEIKDSLKKTTSLSLNTLEIVERLNKECEFSYRESIYKTKVKQEVILSAVFILQNGNKTEIQKKINEKIEYRKNKHPLEYPNIGSIFKNVPIDKFSALQLKDLFQFVKTDPFSVIPAAKLIFLAGLKGKRVGNVMISDKHTNYIVNLGNGKAVDVKKLINSIKDKVHEKFGIYLEEEIMYAGSA